MQRRDQCAVICEASLSPFKYCSACGFLTPKSCFLETTCLWVFSSHFPRRARDCHESQPENRPWGQNYVVCCLLVFRFFLLSGSSARCSIANRFFFAPSNEKFIDKVPRKPSSAPIPKEERKNDAAVDGDFLLHNFKSFSRIQLIYLLLLLIIRKKRFFEESQAAQPQVLHYSLKVNFLLFARHTID